MQIRGEKLTLVYDRGKEFETCALRDINISIGEGQFTGIVGPSGCGKSSLLYVLSGLKAPCSGAVYHDGVNIGECSAAWRSKNRKDRLGFIFQRHFLVEYMSILDNVLSVINSNGKHVRSKARDILDLLSIGHLADQKPSRLSVGQRQRAAIARALINDPEVIFADEPTASLDYVNTQEFMKMLSEYRKNMTVIIVTHDRSILDRMDATFEMRSGRIENCILK